MSPAARRELTQALPAAPLETTHVSGRTDVGCTLGVGVVGGGGGVVVRGAAGATGRLSGELGEAADASGSVLAQHPYTPASKGAPPLGSPRKGERTLGSRDPDAVGRAAARCPPCDL